MTSPTAGPVLVAHAPSPAPADVVAQTAQPATPVLANARPHRVGVVVLFAVGYTLIGLAVVLVLAYFVSALGPGFTALGAVLALIPLAIVFFGIRWIDRWEPEPPALLIFAVLWGATMAALWALGVDTVWQVSLYAADINPDSVSFVDYAIRAPITEEFGKGFGVLLIFLFARHNFDGPIDGIVYAAAVAGGFAFTENIQYFAEAAVGQGGAGDETLGFTFFIRGIMAPFAHVMFTACTGFFIGLASRNGSRWLAFGAFLLGLIPASLLHALWNGSLYFIQDIGAFLAYYAIVQVPLFVIAVVVVAILRRREVLLTQQRLAEYAAAGWLHPDEVPGIASPSGRRAALKWAAQRGIKPTMKSYIRDLTELAFTRQRIISRRDLALEQADERALLGKIAQERATIVAAGPAPAAPAVAQ